MGRKIPPIWKWVGKLRRKNNYVSMHVKNQGLGPDCNVYATCIAIEYANVDRWFINTRQAVEYAQIYGSRMYFGRLSLGVRHSYNNSEVAAFMSVHGVPYLHSKGTEVMIRQRFMVFDCMGLSQCEFVDRTRRLVYSQPTIFPIEGRVACATGYDDRREVFLVQDS